VQWGHVISLISQSQHNSVHIWQQCRATKAPVLLRLEQAACTKQNSRPAAQKQEAHTITGKPHGSRGSATTQMRGGRREVCCHPCICCGLTDIQNQTPCSFQLIAWY
jgi:hypothetical protein